MGKTVMWKERERMLQRIVNEFLRVCKKIKVNSGNVRLWYLNEEHHVIIAIIFYFPKPYRVRAEITIE